jgi:anti-sigma factor RsiW
MSQQMPREPNDLEIARDATYHRAPETLRASVATLVGAAAREESRPRMRRALGLAAAFAAVAIVTWNVALFQAAPSRDDVFAHEVLAAHVRSLMSPGRLMDVESSDQHTVKPWFAGKLDFTPPVRDLAADGFPLAGGRLDYVDGRSVAELTYRRRLHAVSLFVWPEPKDGDTSVKQRSLNGYSLATWRHGGVRYWAVTDAAPIELTHFAELLEAG